MRKKEVTGCDHGETFCVMAGLSFFGWDNSAHLIFSPSPSCPPWPLNFNMVPLSLKTSSEHNGCTGHHNSGSLWLVRCFPMVSMSAGPIKNTHKNISRKKWSLWTFLFCVLGFWHFVRNSQMCCLQTEKNRSPDMINISWWCWSDLQKRPNASEIWE